MTTMSKKLGGKMKSFHNDQTIKDRYIARIKAHELADEIIKGQYWENGKGCAIGCTIHSDNHKAYETELGIPTWLAKVEDCIFESIPNKNAKLWPRKFLEAIPVGVNLNSIKAPFLIFVLESVLNKFDHKRFPGVKKAINNIITLYKNNEQNIEKFRTAGNAAYAAYTFDATYSAAHAYATDTTYAVATSTSVAYAVYSATDAFAANAVTSAAYAAYAHAIDTAYAAKSRTYEEFADKLLELFKTCI